MYGRAGLDRFKKAQSSEPFSVTGKSANKTTSSAHIAHGSQLQHQHQNHQTEVQNTTTVPSQQVTHFGGGQSTWQPPDWAIEPRRGVYQLDVVKDGEVLDKINLDKKRHIFGRQFHTCDFVLDHQSVSRQHAAVVPHKNGRFVISTDILPSCLCYLVYSWRYLGYYSVFCFE